MTSRDFAYWLQGYFEIAKPTTADADTLALIQQHLAMVLAHEIDPSHCGPEEQAKLDALHNPAITPTTMGAMGAIEAYNKKARAEGGPVDALLGHD